MTYLAKFLSWAFLPLFVPVYALAIGMYVENWEYSYFQRNCLYAIYNPEAKEVLMYLFFAFAFLAPAITVAFLQLRGNVDSVMLEKRSQRIIPSVMTIGYGIILMVMLYLKVPIGINGGPFIYGLAAGSLLTVIICTVITFSWKVSLHAAGMGMLSGFLVIYYYYMDYYPLWLLLVCLIVCGLVMSARMYLKLHTLGQLLIGFGIGFLSVVGACLFYI